MALSVCLIRIDDEIHSDHSYLEVLEKPLCSALNYLHNMITERPQNLLILLSIVKPLFPIPQPIKERHQQIETWHTRGTLYIGSTPPWDLHPPVLIF